MRAIFAVALCAFVLAAGATPAGAQFQQGARADANASGVAVVAWAGPGGVRAVFGDRTAGFGSSQLLQGAAAIQRSPQAAIDDVGTAVVVWETYRTLPGAGCSTCEARLLSTGVWVAFGRRDTGFAPPLLLDGPRRDDGRQLGLGEPRLALSRSGHAVVAWSVPNGRVSASVRAPGGGFGPAQPVAVIPAYAADVAVAGDGTAFVSDDAGRVAIRPPGAAFGAPASLPDSEGRFGPRVLLAANAAGDALAAYESTRGEAVVSRRPAGGSWTTPSVLPGPTGSSARAVTLSDGGTGAVAFRRDVGLLAATFGAPGVPAIESPGAPAPDGDMSFDGSGLDSDGAGAVALAFHRAADSIVPGPAQLAYRPAGAAFAGPFTISPRVGWGEDVSFGVDGELLATWIERSGERLRLIARWVVPTIGPAIELDSVPAPAVGLAPPTGHAAQLTGQRRLVADSRGRVRVELRCLSFDGRRCTGTVALSAGPDGWNAGRARFSLAPTQVKRVRVRLTPRARRVLRTRGRVTVTVRARTTRSGGTFGASRSRVRIEHHRSRGQ